jgi:hypothetical protein
MAAKAKKKGWGWAKPFTEMAKKARAEQRELRKQRAKELKEFRAAHKKMYG